MMRPRDFVLAHVGRSFARARERAAQVHVDHGVEVVVAHLPQHGVAQHSGVGDQDIEPTEALHRGGDQTLCGLGRSDRGDDRDGLSAFGLDRGHCGVRGRLVDVVDHDGCAPAGEFRGVRETQAATRSGDDGDFAGKRRGGQRHANSFVSCSIQTKIVENVND